ncbi:MAG: erythromycin biosynthesis sensory transduction protein eryC1 [Caulobacteraceae bacterium]|nr:erythromycin biosynthesis sensory transduction protein eryC1 [Caulobacteraceae bacterium]
MIPFLDLQAQQRALEPELLEAARRVITSGQYVLGAENAAFEREFAEFCGVPHAVAVNTGTSALHLALLAAGVGPGDEVITSPSTFVATIAAIQYAGATPRLVDIDPVTWNLDPALLAQAITPATKVILPVHLHGRLADMDAILDIARAHGLLVIEDACQAHGAEFDGRRAGSFGDLGCFSFYPGKNLGACGEGGAVVTHRADLAERLRLLRDWGQSRKYLHTAKGFNYRMDEIQAAILRVKLPHLERWTRLRRAAAARYDALLDAANIVHAAPANGGEHVYHVYAVRTPNRDELREALAPAVQTNVHYPCPVHLQPAYEDLGYSRGDLPVAERLADETLSLPMFPEITPQQVDTVCARLAAACPPVALLAGQAA